MDNKKRICSENENANSKMSDEDMRIEAFNQYVSGLNHMSDDGKEHNEKESMRCIRKAAELGWPAAQYMLGEYYEFGYNGIKENKTEAVKWYRKAAAQNLPKAEHKLGVLYLIGEGVKKDQEKADEWLFRAAIHGDDEAIEML